MFLDLDMVFPPGLDLGCTFLAGVAQRWCLCSSASCQEAHVSLSQNGWCWEKGRVCSAQRASLTSVFHKDSAAAAKSLQSCRTLCNPIDSSPPGSPIPGIPQARTLERVAISFSRGSSQPKDQTYVSCNGGQILYHWLTREVLISLSAMFSGFICIVAYVKVFSFL